METDYNKILVTRMWEQGITQQQLADALGLDYTTISRKLKPGKTWTVPLYIKALEFLGVDPAEAFGSNYPSVGPLENGGMMGEVFSVVQRLSFYRKKPEEFISTLRKLSDIEQNSPQDFDKILHDVEYLHKRLKKAPAASQQKNAQ